MLLTTGSSASGELNGVLMFQSAPSTITFQGNTQGLEHAGRPIILTEEEERSIVRSCQALAQAGFGVDCNGKEVDRKGGVGRVVRDYLQAQERDTPFKVGLLEEVVAGLSEAMGNTC